MPSQQRRRLLVDEPPAIAARLRKARGRRGLTQAEAARLLGIAQSSVAAYEAGKIPPVDLWNALVDLYLISADQLFLAPRPGRPPDRDRRRPAPAVRRAVAAEDLLATTER